MDDIQVNFDDVRVIKLVSGETVIGFSDEDLDEEFIRFDDEDFLILEHGYSVDYRWESGKEEGFILTLSKWMPFIDKDTLVLRRESIIAVGFPEKELLESYITLLHQEFGEALDDGKSH